MEERKEKRIYLERPAEEDLISQLPDALISQILLYLPTKEAVRTSVLSKRWKSLWIFVPGLDLDSNEFPDYKSFVVFFDKFLSFSREQMSCLHKLKLSIMQDESDQTCVTRLLDFVIRGKLMHLDVKCHHLKFMPVSLYICETLLYLRVHGVYFAKFESVSLPHLKTMRLERNVYANEAVLESLISSCPALEDLSIVRRVDENVKVVRVHSQTLTSLSIGFELDGNHRVYYRKGEQPGLWIDAPRLKYLYSDTQISETKIISNTGSLVKVSFVEPRHVSYPCDGFDLSMLHSTRNCLNAISRVRDMILSKDIMEMIYFYLRVEPLPQFCNLTYLEAGFYNYTVKILPTFLERCPNIKSIVLDLTYSNSLIPSRRFSFVPQCLLSSLEFVEIKSLFRGRPLDIGVARYFVQNSRVLKKLVLHLCRFRQNQSLDDLRDLLALPRPSSMCQILYDEC